jgi:hypothetical protein
MEAIVERVTEQPNWIFKSSAGFFDVQCKVGHTKIEKDKGIVALVLDARERIGGSVAVKIEQDGRQLAILRVASDDGGFIVLAHTPSARGDKLQPDDLVIWVPSVYCDELGEAMQDKRSGWVGLITDKIAPELPFKVFCHYD